MAGLYIKGMEMPKDKWGYTEIQIWGDGLITTREGKMLTWGKYAIEVPDHGDLIDRKALRKKMTDFCDKQHEEAAYTGNRIVRINWDDALDFIKSASVVIPADKEEV